MKVREIMTKNVLSIESGKLLKEALVTMNDNRIGSIIITKNGKPIGIITERDVIKFISSKSKIDFETVTVDSAMTRWLVIVTPTSSIESAVELMRENDVKKLPVVENDVIVGIITITDIAAIKPKIMKK